MTVKTRHPVLLQRLAASIAAALLLCIGSLYVSAAEPPVTFQEHRSIHGATDDIQADSEQDVSVEYQIGGTQIKSHVVINGDENYDGVYHLSQPLTRAERITVSVAHNPASPTEESFFVFYVPENTVVETPHYLYGLDHYKGKTIADVKAVLEARYGLGEYDCLDSLYDYDDPYDDSEDVEYGDETNRYRLKKGYLYRVSVSTGEENAAAPENFYFCVG